MAAIATTLLILAILAGMKPIEERWRDRMQTRGLRIVVKRGAMSIDTLHAATGARASRVRQFVVRPGGNADEEVVTVSFVRLSQTSVDAIARKLRQNPSVLSVDPQSE